MEVEDECTKKDNDVTQEYAPTHFVESSEVLLALHRIKESLPRSYDEIVRDASVVRDVTYVEAALGNYQEFPQLIKPFIEALVEPLTEVIVSRLPALETTALVNAESSAAPSSVEPKLGQNYGAYEPDAERSAIHTAARLIYIVAKVVGPKSVTAFFPHEVRLVERVFYSLREWQISRHHEWEVRYALLLWLCNLVLVPFELTTVDSTTDSSLGQRMLQSAIQFLGDPSKCHEAAALLIARLMTRPDSGLRRLAFFRHTASELESMKGAASHVRHGGLLRAVATTFKIGKRDELLAHAMALIPLIAEHTLTSSDAVVCKTAVKVMQRLGLTCLPCRVHSWQYRKTLVDLERNLCRTVAAQPSVSSQPDVSDDSDIDVPDELETVIDVLLRALSHTDTIVRYSAAKGIGRVCERLPKAFADEVVSAVLERFTVHDSDCGWHGACLSLAELCRRNVLLPQRFEVILPIIKQALIYDVLKGSYSVGANVRDAACYVCWSVARAYSVDDLRAHVFHLSSSLIVTALLDREVNVRRAAAAAFQESVGRLGEFPHGIELVQLVDFFSVSSIVHTYTTLAPEVAKLEPYREALLNHIYSVKLRHWDREVRRVSAVAIGLIGSISLDQIQQVISDLFDASTSALTAHRHGAILGLAELVRNLPPEVWHGSARLANLIATLESKRLFRGRGGEYVRQACCLFLAAIAHRQLTLPSQVNLRTVAGDKIVNVHSLHHDFLEDTWKQPLEWLQESAAEAFAVYSAQYYGSLDEKNRGKMVIKMLKGLAEECPPNERRGCVLALGSLPLSCFSCQGSEGSQAVVDEKPSPLCTVDSVFHAILNASVPSPSKPPEEQDPECRRNAVQAMVKLLLRLLASGDPSALHAASLHVASVTGALLRAFDDYAIDKRGDVGMFVRSAAISATPSLLASLPHDMFPRCRCDELIGALLKQSVEKIDKVRQLAGTSLVVLSKERDRLAAACSVSSAKPSAYADVHVLCCVLDDAAKTVRDWGAPAETFPLLVSPRTLSLETFRSYLVEGLVTAVGGKVVHVAKPALTALGASMNDNPALRNSVARDLINVAAAYRGVSRMTEPIYCAMDRLLDQRLLEPSALHAFTMHLVGELNTFTKEIKILLPLVAPLASLCRWSPSGPAREAAWRQMLLMLCSRFPAVRKNCSVELYTVVTALQSERGNLQEGVNLEQAANTLVTIQWDEPKPQELRSARDVLCGLLGIPPLTQAADPTTILRPRKEQQDFSSYRRLVDEVGF